MNSNHKPPIRLLVLFSIGLLTIGGDVGTATIAFGLADASELEDSSTVSLYEHLAPATVFLSVVYESVHPLSHPQTTGVGAGFLVDDAGTVLTNAHVVDGASSITATLFDGTSIKAELLALDPTTDVAILQLASAERQFVPVKLGDSTHLRVGQNTFIVGSPFGLGFTLTTGIISGLGPPAKRAEAVPPRLIQTTAPINPGNSGGPLVDSRGRVIGITTAMLMGAQNIGFAIPIHVAKEVLRELREKGTIVRPWFGVTGKFVTDEIRNLVALPLTSGFLVEDVEDESPAAKVGLRSGTLHMVLEGVPWILGGDIVVALNGQSVRTVEAFVDVMKTLPVGQEIQIEIMRDGERLRNSLIVRERPAGSLRPTAPSNQQAAGAMSRWFSPIVESRLVTF